MNKILVLLFSLVISSVSFSQIPGRDIDGSSRFPYQWDYDFLDPGEEFQLYPSVFRTWAEEPGWQYQDREITFPPGYGYAGRFEIDNSILAERITVKGNRKINRSDNLSKDVNSYVSASASLSQGNDRESTREFERKFTVAQNSQSKTMGVVEFLSVSFSGISVKNQVDDQITIARVDGQEKIEYDCSKPPYRMMSGKMRVNRMRYYFLDKSWDGVTEWKLISSIDYEYSDDSQIISSSIVSSFYPSSLRFEYKYNDKGRLIERLEFSGDSYFPSDARHYSYHEFGEIARITFKSAVDRIIDTPSSSLGATFLQGARCSLRSGDFEMSFSYRLDEYNRWVSADVQCSGVECSYVSSERYAHFTNRKPTVCSYDKSPHDLWRNHDTYQREEKSFSFDLSSQLIREIRYRADTSPLSKYVDDDNYLNETKTLTQAEEAEWFENLSKFDSTRGESAIMYLDFESSCFPENHKSSKAIYETLFSAYYKLLERDKIDEILREQKLSLSGLFDENQKIEVGLLVGAKLALFIEAGCSNMKQSIHIKCVDLETSDMLWTITGFGATDREVSSHFKTLSP